MLAPFLRVFVVYKEMQRWQRGKAFVQCQTILPDYQENTELL